MKSRIFSLESIQQEQESIVATPVTGVALYDAPNLVTFDGLDNEAAGWVKDIGENTEAVIGLEAISHQLAKSTKDSLGNLGAKYANLAVEQICNKANFALEEMPLDVKAYETDSAAAVSGGVQSLQETIGSLQKTEEKDLVSLLTVITSKRDLLNRSIRSTYARLGEIDENLVRIAQLGGDVGPSEQELNNAYYVGVATVDGRAATLPTTCSSIKHFLANHSHVYKRLVKKQLDWITDHKDNLLTSVNGFNQYSFDPKEYVISGANGVNSGTMQSGNFYYSDTLPGRRVFTVEVPGRMTYGYEATDALMHTVATLAYTDDADASQSDMVAPTLSLEDIRARSAEVKSLMEDIRHWSDVAYVKLWKDAIYDCDVIGHLLTEKAENLNQRGLTALANVVIDLLHKSDGGVGMYAIVTASAVLEYVEQSLSKYVTHQEVFDK